MARIAGVAYVKVGSDQLAIAGTCDIGAQKVTREPMTGMDGKTDYVETPVAPFVEVEGKATPGRDILAMEDFTDVTVTVELANGRTYSLGGAFWSGGITVSGAEGTYTGRFTGDTLREF